MLDRSRAVVNRNRIVLRNPNRRFAEEGQRWGVASGTSRPRENDVYTLRPIDRINSSPLLFVTTPSRRR